MMYLIATKLTQPVDSPAYEGLVLAIKALGPWSDRLDGAWMVQSHLHAGQIRTLLKAHLQPGDRVFVAQFTQNWAGFNMGKQFPEWIKRRDFQVERSK
jgi:hypothetical protein